MSIPSVNAMKIIAAIEADLVTTPLGTPSRLADDLCGKSVLRRTFERVCTASELEDVFLICPSSQASSCSGLLGHLPMHPRTVDSPPPPYRQLVRLARKWSLDGWRGGIGGACVWDEYTSCATLAELALAEGADAVWTIAPASPLVDPALINEMAAWFRRNQNQLRMVFAQAPPGVVGTIFETSLLAELAEKRRPPSWVISYKPDFPAMDLALKDCCIPTAQPIRHAYGRLIADTDASWPRLTEYLSSHTTTDAESVCRWLIDRERTYVPDAPEEVEIELTTDDQLSDTVLRPRGTRIGRRQPLAEDTVHTLIDGNEPALRGRRVVIGGFGEPLLHPQLESVLSAIMSASPAAVAVHSNGIALDDERIEMLFRCRVDLVCVTLDAATPETYRAVHGLDRFEKVKANVIRLEQAHVRYQQVAPLVVVQLTKAQQTLSDMEAFVDGWTRMGIWPVIVGQSRYAGQWPDHTVANMSPPLRTACRRIRNRTMILADGTVIACDQDFGGLYPVGRLPDQSLAEIWRGPAYQKIRYGHACGDFGVMPLCPNCDEWHRP